MSIEVIAKAGRENAVFMAGESFTVSIILSNTDTQKCSSLAWGCVQLHCDQILLRSSALNNSQKQIDSQKTTSVPSRGKQSIYSSAPVIIFCDARLKPSETIQFDHIVALPLHLPPSFKGYFVKYNWYVSVAVQHVDAPINVLQLPIKVLNVTVDVVSLLNAEEEKSKIKSENPFLVKEIIKPSIVELALNKIEEITSVKSIRAFDIKSVDSVFAVITLYKSFYKLGDDICGRIIFLQNYKNASSISCLQVLIRVETMEVNLYGNKREENIVYQSSEHLVTAFIKETYFKVSIPLTFVPAFSTEAVQLRWRLHFEFVTSAQKPIELYVEDLDKSSDVEFTNGSNVNLDEGENISKLASDLTIEAMAWDWYISVHSCNPHNIGLVSSVPSSRVSFIV